MRLLDSFIRTRLHRRPKAYKSKPMS